MLFADDAAVAAHSRNTCKPMDWFSQECQDFSLTISLNKIKISVNINNYTLEAVSTFTYLGCTITNNLDTEFSSCIGKAASTFGKLTARVWDNAKLTVHTKIQVYRACVVSTLLSGCEA